MPLKSYISRFLLLALCSVLTSTIIAQRSSTNYELQLKSDNYSIESNIDQLMMQKEWIPTEQIYAGNYYALLMFNSIPNEKTKSILSSNGVELYEYIPNYTYMAVLKSNASLLSLKKAGVRSIVNWNNNYKLAPSLLGDEYPEHALRPGNRIELRTGFYRNLEESDALIALQNKFNVEILDVNSSIKRITLSIPISDLTRLSSEPYITYIEPIDPPSEPENYTSRTVTRSNAIANDYASGRKYDGTGVTVMLQDDGLVGPHIDYEGRVDNSSTTSNNGDHGDHIAGTIMGAGNLDPTVRGFAFAADLVVYNVYAGITDIANAVNNRSVVITSTSYSNGCNAGYTSFAQEHDQNIIDYPSLMHVFSAGNSQGSDCGYGAGSQWANITGGHKVGKNVIAVAALDQNDGLASFSSVGPAHDGRIKPDVGAKGVAVYSTTNPNAYTTKSGTSMSCPNVSGSLAQLYSAYKQLNAGANPPSALMKATIMNTADDLGNAGPDYKFGYGRVNNLRAAKTLENGHYMSSTITQGVTNTHNISVPADVQELRVMVYWPDVPAAVNANPALVNDLNMTLTDPGALPWQPWVLDPTPNATTLNNPATRGLDNLNNVEQVTLDAPAAGTYTVSVNGFAIPGSAQTYYIVYSFVLNEIEVTYPVGGEPLVPGESEIIRWEAYGSTGTFTVEYSDDNGATWNTISSTVAGNLRQLNWTVPATGNIPTGRMLVRVTRGSLSDVSDANFSTIAVPTGLTIDWQCVDSISISWNPVTGATGYIAYVLGVNYMDSVGTTSNTSMILTGLNPTLENWISVSAIGPENANGRRAFAINKPANTNNCPLPIDAGVVSFISPSGGTLNNCQDLTTIPVTIQVRNYGIDPLSNIPVTYTLNGGAGINGTIAGPLAAGTSVNFTFPGTIDLSAVGTNVLQAYSSMAGDGNPFNDTTNLSIETIAGVIQSLPYSENFETFPLCGTGTDCGVTICNVTNGWLNNLNGSADDVDWRTDDGGTGSTGTGPSNDHDPGTISGNYLYLETSGTCASQTGELVSPCIDLSGTTSPQLSFWYHMYGATMGSLHVDLLTGGTWINDIIPAISGDQGNVWLQQVIDLTAYSGQQINIRFRGITGSSFTSDMAIDDIEFFELAPPSTAFTADNTTPCVNEVVSLTDNSANVPTSWTWTITPGTHTYVNGTNSSSQNPQVSFSAVGNYTVKLLTSNPIGSDSLTQTGFIVVGNGTPLPFSEDFESFSNCLTTTCGAACILTNGWTNAENITDDNTDWFIDEGGTPSVGTGPTVDFNPGTTVGNYIYVEASSCFNQSAHLITPCLDLNGTTLPQLTYRYHMSGINMGTLHIDVFDGTVWNLDVATPISGNQGANWNLASINLGAFAGATINIRFRGETGSSFESDIAIDDINVLEVAVPPIAGFTSAKSTVCVDGSSQLTDQSSNIPNAWSWTITPGTHTYIGGTSDTSQNPLVQFNAQGTYDIRLITSNPFGSDTINRLAIVTATTGSLLPVMEDFESGTVPPAGGWTIDNPDNAITWAEIFAITGSSGAATTAAYVNNYSYNAAGQEDGLTTLILDLSGIINPLLTFDIAYAPYSAQLFETLRIDVSTDCGDNFSPTAYQKSGDVLGTVPATTASWSPTLASHWRNDSLDLTAYTGNSLLLRFVNVTGYGNGLYVDNINIEESFCAPPVLSALVTDATCNGGNEGTIDLTVSGGSPPYSFLWSTGAITEDVSGLIAGFYTVTVTDNEGCSAITVEEVDEPSPVSATSSKGNVTCSGQDNGSARVVVSGGVGPYTYLWDTSPTQTTDQVNNLAGGNYNCIITDSDGCTKSVDVTIFNPTALFAFSIPNNPSPGDINLAVSGGIAPYAYNWSTGASTEDVFGLAPGFYFCQIADRNGCAQIHALVLSAPQSAPNTDFAEERSFKSDDDMTISLFPNPTSENTSLQIKLTSDKYVVLELIDINGRSLSTNSRSLKAGISNLEISTSGLPSGIYQLIVRSDNLIRTEKIVKE